MSDYEALRTLEARMSTQEQHTMQCSADVAALKEAIRENNEALAEYIELSKGFKSLWKLLGFVEKVAVWIAKIAAALGIVWGIWVYLVQEALKGSPK